MQTQRHYKLPNESATVPNLWDLAAFILIASIVACLGWAAQQMTSPYQVGEHIPISLDVTSLPIYALRTVFRMGVALILSLIFSLIFGTLSAKYKQAERIIIPAIDILQSVPILGFLSITVVGFISLFPGSLLGPECAAIFAIFTSQAWNMALSVYQSVKTVPKELIEAGNLFKLSAWQRFWRIEIPFAAPGLIWNAMISLSGGWFFVVACEAISVSNQNIMLPGMGSYIAIAIQEANMTAVGHAILVMLIVILIYDQVVFRPLLSWSEKFRTEDALSETPVNSWLLTLFKRTHIWQHVGEKLSILITGFINLSDNRRSRKHTQIASKTRGKTLLRIWNCLLLLLVIVGATFFIRYIHANIPVSEVFYVIMIGLFTALRVFVLIVICSCIWIPVGVWVGLRPRIARIVQPIAQFFAAFPANLVFPIVVVAIVKFKLNVEIWTAPLMILGTQWYILFNVIAGSQAIPRDLYLAAENFGVKGSLWWRKIAMPAIFPYFVTGALAAAGGAWNASIVAESVNWGNTTLTATGLGAYITKYTATGDFPRITLGIGIMCLYVYCFNRLLWQRLYDYAEKRCQIE